MSWYFLHRSNVAQRDDFPKIVLKETRNLPLPKLSASNRTLAKQLATAAGRLIDISNQRSNSPEGPRKAALDRQFENTDRQIDHLVYQIYGLSAEEMQLVENTQPTKETPQEGDALQGEAL